MQIPFYSRNTTRKFVVAFMDFFQNISVERLTTDPVSGQVVHKYIRVPVMWATTEKWLQVLNSTTARKGFEEDRIERIPVEMEWVLPRIGVSMTGLTYDSVRHVGKQQRIESYMNKAISGVKTIYAPVPYNLELELSVVTKNANDLFQIAEQIVPFFSPSLSLNVKQFEVANESESVAVILTSVSPELEDEITETDERIFRMSFSFIMKINYFLPEKLDAGKIIKRINANYAVVPNATDFTNYDPTYYTFDQYVQRAKLDVANGEAPDIIDVTLNPILVEHTQITGAGLYDSTKTYKNGEYIMHNGIKMRFREGIGWVVEGSSLQVGQQPASPDDMNQTKWDI
jgi:hypothetical protein